MARMGIGEKSLRSQSLESGKGHQKSASHEELELKKKKSSDPHQAKSSATGSSAQKNYYQEFLKAQETFRRSSGLLVSAPLGPKENQPRRNSYSQGRQTRSENLNLVDETKISFRNRTKMKYRLIRSPLGLTSFRNHQIDEVAEDGVTEARDQDRTENEDNNQ